MKPIGGYVDLELPSGKELYRNAIRLHTARNCLEYILRVLKPGRVLLPILHL